MTWGAYCAIPCVLAYFGWKRKDMAFPSLFWLFSAFILFCGFVHLVEAAIFWWPMYRLSAVLKAMTAAVSGATVVALFRVVPSALALPGLAAINAELDSSRAVLRTMVDSSSSLIGLLSPDGVLLEANSKALRAAGALGGPTRLPVGRKFWESWPDAPELQGRLREAVRDCAGGMRVAFDASLTGQDGSPMIVYFSLSPVLIEDVVTYLVPEARDVTEQRRHDEHLQGYARRLERSNEDLESFAYIASHDLRSPLRSVSQLASWIVEDEADALSPEGRDILDKLGLRVQRMQGLLDDLLAYSRIDADGEAHVEVDVRAMVEQIVETLGVPEGFAVEIVGELPVFRTSPTPLKLIFRNLINNAIKHHDKQRGFITVQCRVLPDRYEFRVSDDGPGIAAQYHERIFGLFQTLESRDTVEGSGMGLAMIEKTLTRFGGTIRVESQEGEGAAFIFEWPGKLASKEASHA